MFISLTFNMYMHKNIINHVQEKEMSIENIYDELLNQGVLFPEIVLKQVKLETGHLKHVHDNNLFGFRTSKGYLKFENWIEAIAYKKSWQERKYKGGDYYAFLKKLPYAEDPIYIEKLKKIK